MTTTILAWTFIFAVPLFAFVYAWFVMKEDSFDELPHRMTARMMSLIILGFACLIFGKWLLNLPA